MPQTEQQMAEFFSQRGFGLKLGFGERPALIVIDLMNAFTDPSMPLGAPLEDQIEATRTLLRVARQAHIPIFYTVVSYDGVDIEDAGIWALKQRGATTLRAGTPAVELDARLERQPGEPIIIKKYASAFFGTDLIARLNSRRIDTLLIAGCTTSGCVRASAVDAVQLGIRPMVVEQAVGDRAEAAHKQSLFDLQQKYADVVSLQETLEYVGSLAQPRSRMTASAAS